MYSRVQKRKGHRERKRNVVHVYKSRTRSVAQARISFDYYIAMSYDVCIGLFDGFFLPFHSVCICVSFTQF